jgi:S1-C subfamily serine protease
MIKVYDDNLVNCGNGSGVVVDEFGTIVTNFHVIKGGSNFGIIFENNANEVIHARLNKINQNYDLALLKIDRKTKPIPIKDKDNLNRGQQIVAIGSPLGLMNTISDGIVAGFRNFDDEKFIQITAPISPGSSGGALLDMFGYLVGITTAGYSEGQNLNLAVPSSEVLLILNRF